MTAEERAKELERASRDDPSTLDKNELSALIGEGSWTLRMHVCRMLPRVNWASQEYPIIREFLLRQSEDRNTFVRAWALDSLASFAVADESIRPHVLGLIDEALANGPSSVRVRARESLQRLGKRI